MKAEKRNQRICGNNRKNSNHKRKMEGEGVKSTGTERKERKRRKERAGKKDRRKGKEGKK